jgi:hypothetical protein
MSNALEKKFLRDVARFHLSGAHPHLFILKFIVSSALQEGLYIRNPE